ncbi:hypothetical protein [Xenorhabdus lircayensis]|uniref:Uncharacterized protein n=1 Tax=Xenorhabdus lircayensis TaxID=2763499 RepID=A0ABS0U909_9GAMM|nr:hypothetical protein [Xenorhabdus lircayensis]MBI6550117.1 hypothetical protein [Xenorhabdus lircayensis]
MKHKIFSKGWFKDLSCFFIKELLWTNIPVVAIFTWSMISLYFFSEEWWISSLVGSAVILFLTFILIYINEKKKS